MSYTEQQYAALQRRMGKPGVIVPLAKRQKFGNKKTISNGRVFASGHEARRYAELELMQHAGKIRNLQRQVPYDMVVNAQHICTYLADATYERRSRDLGRDIWLPVVEDAKSVATRKRPEYSLKRKLMRACHGIEIQEIL